jgi:site-specific DNA recombinase
MQLAAYIRVSRVGGREGDSFISPKVQRERIAAWAAAQGNDIAEWFEDLDQPGSRLERPGLTAAMSLVESGQAGGIIVAKLDRFGRSVVHLAGLIDRLRAADGALFSVAEGIDTRGPTGKLIADILGAIAEWELGRIRDNWAAARQAAVDRGIHIAHTVPPGYTKEGKRPYELDPQLAPVIRELFTRRAQRESWAGLARWFSEETGRNWTVGAIRSMIANRVYLGEARGGGSMVNRTAHPPIVSRAEFGAANEARGISPGRSGRGSGLLSGILRCAGCRYAMKPSVSKTRHGKPFMEYRCKSARSETAGGRCKASASVKASVIEPYVMEAFWQFVGDYRATGFTRVTEELEAAEQVLRVARNELDAALDTSLVDALGGSDSEAYLETIRRRREAVEEAEAAIAAIQRSTPPDPDIPESIVLSELWPDLSLVEQRRLLSAAFETVFVRRTPSGRGGEFPIADRTWFCLWGEAPELPVRGKRWTPEPFDFPGAPRVPVAEDSG